VLEQRFIELCEQERIPLPQVNVKVAGYNVVRYSWEQVTEHAADVAADLRAALAAG
jgi:hypothetical protein